MNNTVMGIIPNRYAELNTDVLMLDDYITNNEGRTVDSVVKQVDIMRTAGLEKGLPMYYFVSSGNSPLHYRPPTYREQLASVALAGGRKDCRGTVPAKCLMLL